MDFVEIYNECKNAYDKMYNGLRTSLEYYEAKQRNDGILFNADRYADMFEVMFQFAALQVLASCGKLSTEEGHIIRDITVERDVIEYIREFKPNTYGWDDLENMSQENFNNFMESNKTLMEALMSEFVTNVSKAIFEYNSREFNINTMSMLLTSFIINLLNVDNDKSRRYYDNNILLDCFSKIRNEVNDLRRKSLAKK